MALAQQLTNVGARGQDARYNIAGLQQVAPGVYTDGTYQYDSNGLDLSGRKADQIAGLRGADENYVDGVLSVAGGGGGGGGGGLPAGSAAIVAQELLLAKQAYDTALAKITNQRQSLSTNAGMTFTLNDDGTPKNFGVDTHSIYGTYQVLNRQQAQRDEDARATAIERGLGAGGGLAAQLRSNAKYQSGQEDTQFASDLNTQFTDLGLQQQDAKQAYDRAKYQAELDQIRLASPYSFGGGGGGGGYSPQPSNPVGVNYTAPGFQNATANVGQVQPNGYSINTGGGFYTPQTSNDLTAKWKKLAGL